MRFYHYCMMNLKLIYYKIYMQDIIIGEGSYGKILYNKTTPGFVSKLHFLSSHEQETGCDELFQHEYNFHNKLYQQLLAKSVSNFIIPKPINYKRITQHSDACIYNMEKLNYPSMYLLKNIIKPEILNNYSKSNPDVHSPPYLLFSAISDDYENGKVKLTSMQGFTYWNSLYYIEQYPPRESNGSRAEFPLAPSLAKTMMVQYFALTFDTQVILQDVEFLLAEKNGELCVGLIDFNQVSDFDTRIKIASRRIPNYSIDYDIANTYLFLSGIDTGYILTDRNTQWKFLPLPHILPHLFFKTMQQIQYNYPIHKIVDIICSTIYKMEIETVMWNNIYNKVMVWHEILIYGAIDAELFSKLNIKYEIYDSDVANSMIQKYSYFSTAQNNKEFAGFEEYYILTSNEDQNYLERLKYKQNIGVISQNLLDSIVYYDIMYQRLFIIKLVSTIGINNINVKKFEKLLENNADYKTIIAYLQKTAKRLSPKNKTNKRKKSFNEKNKTRKSIQKSSS